MKQLRILVVDDDAALCDLVRTALELEGLEVVEAHHVVEAERLIAEGVPDAIVLDIGLPGIDGLFYCQRLRERAHTRQIPVIAISGSEDTGALAIAAGATVFVQKPFDPLELLTVIELAIGIPPLGRAFGPEVSDEVVDQHAAQLGRLIEIGRHRHEQLAHSYRQTLAALAASLEIRGARHAAADPEGSEGAHEVTAHETSAHIQRTTAYAMRLTLEVAPALSDEESLEWGFLLHDFGNIGVPEHILLKRSSLNSEEWQTMKQHTTIGEELLLDVPLVAGEGLRVVRSHHERWDGSGYPDGIAGSEIPLGARIFAVADALDAMTDRRHYRRPLRWDAALARLRKDAGSQFDPDVVDGLIACEPDLLAIRRRFLEQAPGRPRATRASALLPAHLLPAID